MSYIIILSTNTAIIGRMFYIIILQIFKLIPLYRIRREGFSLSGGRIEDFAPCPRKRASAAQFIYIFSRKERKGFTNSEPLTPF
jgi:hypothetical protein